MCSQIDELLKRTEYDIYNNPDVSDEGIKTIAEMIAADKNIDLKVFWQKKIEQNKLI